MSAPRSKAQNSALLLFLVAIALIAMCAHSLAVLRPQFPPKPHAPYETVTIVVDDAKPIK